MREMLTCIDSYELTEWMAFERAFGPITYEWQNYALGAIHQQLLMGNGMFGEVNFESNPVDKVEPIIPPHEWIDRPEPDEDAPPDLGAYE